MSPVIKQWSDLVVEDVDDDAQDDDVSYKHELMLLAGPGDSGFCRNELVKLLRAEQRERGDAAAACRKGASMAADSSAPVLNHFGLPTSLVFATIYLVTLRIDYSITLL
jgi:hypothetical protein